MDVLVRWDNDDTDNVVSRSELKVIGGGRLVVGSRVKMWWGLEGKWWKGTVLMLRPVIVTHQSESPTCTLNADLLINDVCDPSESVLGNAVEALNSSSFFRREHSINRI